MELIVNFLSMFGVWLAVCCVLLVYARWRRKRLWRERTHMSFVLSFKRMVVPWLVLSLLCWVTAVLRHGFGYPALLLGAFLVSVSLVHARWMTYICASEIGPDGIVGNDTAGFFRFFQWPEVTDANGIHLGIGRFMRVYGSAQKSPLWIWEWMDDREGFEAHLRQWLPEDHPVIKYINAR